MSSGKPVLAVDIDGVVADFMAGLHKQARAFGMALPEPADYYFSTYTEEQLDFTKGCFGDYRFYLNLLPVIGAKPALWQLSQLFDLVAITSRPYANQSSRLNLNVKRATELWVEKYELPFKRVLYVPAAQKASIIKLEEPEVVAAVDDNPEVCRAYAEEGLRSYMIAWPYNEAAKLTEVIPVVDLFHLFDIEEQVATATL